MADSRSKKLLLVCHCILNQNSKIEGFAQFPGVFRPAVELILQSNVGIYQLPCPEMTYLGISRWGSVKDQYNSPFFRRHCQNLAERVVDEVEDYTRRGYRILALASVEGSPTCGVNFTVQPAAEPWGGIITSVPADRFVAGRGTFMEVLQKAIKARELAPIPFIGLPEIAELGDLNVALSKLENILSG